VFRSGSDPASGAEPPPQRGELGLCPVQEVAARILSAEEDPHIEEVAPEAREEHILGHAHFRLALPATVVPELGEGVGQAFRARQVVRLAAVVGGRNQDAVRRQGAQGRVGELARAFMEPRGRRLAVGLRSV
jgi:hypothetical protein